MLIIQQYYYKYNNIVGEKFPNKNDYPLRRKILISLVSNHFDIRWITLVMIE